MNSLLLNLFAIPGVTMHPSHVLSSHLMLVFWSCWPHSSSATHWVAKSWAVQTATQLTGVVRGLLLCHLTEHTSTCRIAFVCIGRTLWSRATLRANVHLLKAITAVADALLLQRGRANKQPVTSVICSIQCSAECAAEEPISTRR